MGKAAKGRAPLPSEFPSKRAIPPTSDDNFGDESSAKKNAKDLFGSCLDMINQYLEYSILNKPYEIDPFMKAAWIVKESQGLFPEKEYRVMLDKADELLSIVMGKRGQAKGSFEQANALYDELIDIRLNHGWID